MKNRIRIARGTKAQLNTVNDVLPIGTPVFTTDEKKLYIGDGVTQGKNLKAVNATNAENVTDKINGMSISSIFESDGKTARKAKNSVRSTTVTYISDNIAYEIVDETTVLDFMNRVLTNQIKVLSIDSGDQVIPRFSPSSMKTTGSSSLTPANYEIANLSCAPSLALLNNSNSLYTKGYCEGTLSGGTGITIFMSGTYDLHISSRGEITLDYYLQYMNYAGTLGTNASIYQVYGSNKPLTKFGVKYFI